MNQRVYKFQPGKCMCVLGDPFAGAMQVPVLKISGSEVVLDPAADLRENQFVYTTVELEDGPSLALSGLVVGTAAQGILLQWMHSDPREADRVNAILSEYESRDLSGVNLESSEEAQAAVHAQHEERTATITVEDAPAEESAGEIQAAEEAQAARQAHATLEATVRKRESTRSGRDDSTQESAADSTRDDRKASDQPGPRRPGSQVIVGDNVVAKKGSRKRATARAPASPPASASLPSASPSEPIRLRQGSLDVDATIRRHAQTVSSTTLAARLKTVQVIQMDAIKGLIQDAVNETVASLKATLSSDERKRLVEEAEEGFRERLERFQAEKADLETQTQVLQEQLDKAQSILEEERHRIIEADQFTLSDAGVVELQARLERILSRVVQKGRVSRELEGDLRHIVAGLLNEEREKIRQKAEEAQGGRIELLEKKIGRLARSLEVAEKEKTKAERRAQVLESTTGSFRMPTESAGLDEDDPAREKKLGLLKELFELNRKIRSDLVETGRLPPRRDAGGEAPVAADSEGGEVGADEQAGSPTQHAQQPAPPPPPVSEEDEEAGAEQESEDTDLVPDEMARMLAAEESESEEIDPDDQPWEPRQKSTAESGSEDGFRRFG